MVVEGEVTSSSTVVACDDVEVAMGAFVGN